MISMVVSSEYLSVKILDGTRDITGDIDLTRQIFRLDTYISLRRHKPHRVSLDKHGILLNSPIK